MAKVTQAAANYRRGDPVDHCGVCQYYRGNSCTQVEGDISPFGISDIYMADKDNPFGAIMSPQQKAAIKQIASPQGPGGAGGPPMAPQGRPMMPPPRPPMGGPPVAGGPMPPRPQPGRPFFG